VNLEGWLDLFRRHARLRVIHLNHLEILTGMNRHALRVALSRLTARGILRRICRGYYANPFAAPGLEEISAEIYRPSYVSLESALHRHGILSQAPQVLTCVTTRLPRTTRTSFGTILYRQIRKACFFGFVREGEYALADPEKALTDFLYLSRGADARSVLSELDLSAVRRRRLESYARRVGLPKVILP
jgi:predicted transcriptional regulator of viral defense system